MRSGDIDVRPGWELPSAIILSDGGGGLQSREKNRRHESGLQPRDVRCPALNRKLKRLALSGALPDSKNRERSFPLINEGAPT